MDPVVVPVPPLATAIVVPFQVPDVMVPRVVILVDPAAGALEVSVGWTWSARAKVVPVPMAAVPSMTGLVLEACPRTKAVVAICVVFVFTDAVGAEGVPVKVWLSTTATVPDVGRVREVAPDVVRVILFAP